MAKAKKNNTLKNSSKHSTHRAVKSAGNLQLSATVLGPPIGHKVETPALLREAFELWLDGEQVSWVRFRLVVWGSREIKKMDYSETHKARTTALATAIRRSLPPGGLIMQNTMGVSQ